MSEELKDFELGFLLSPELLEVSSITNWESVRVRSLSIDSRNTSSGDVFFALSGTKTQGYNFIGDALAKGAVAIIVDSSQAYEWNKDKCSCPVLLVKDAHVALSSACHRMFSDPDQAVGVIGVTGTNGKTSIAWIISEALMELTQNACGYLGTLGGRIVRNAETAGENDPPAGKMEEEWLPTANTTPDILTSLSFIDKVRKQDGHWVALELSSHALDQKRALGIALNSAIITNLTRDHLDYHHTMEEYGRAKEKLFSELLYSSSKLRKTAVFNLDDPFCFSLYNKYREQAEGFKSYCFSLSNAQADVELRKCELSLRSTLLEVSFGAEIQQIECKLIGQYNVSNLLAAATCLWSLGFAPTEIATAFRKISVVPGRMQLLDWGVGSAERLVFIDYAHTPDALSKVIGAIRELNPRRIILVFGCGGDRDRGKRSQMGEVAARDADYSIITNDNPRSEDPDLIAAEIEAGVVNVLGPKHEHKCEIILDREQAIEKALAISEQGDVVIIAGKGHETYQEARGERRFFSDVAVTKRLFDLR